MNYLLWSWDVSDISLPLHFLQLSLIRPLRVPSQFCLRGCQNHAGSPAQGDWVASSQLSIVREEAKNSEGWTLTMFFDVFVLWGESNKVILRASPSETLPSLPDSPAREPIKWRPVPGFGWSWSRVNIPHWWQVLHILARPFTLHKYVFVHMESSSRSRGSGKWHSWDFLEDQLTVVLERCIKKSYCFDLLCDGTNYDFSVKHVQFACTSSYDHTIHAFSG